MISVIVATYNQEDTIARTLDSVLAQQCHLPIEIVVGDDCSQDHTGAICDDYALRHPDRIRLFHNPRNKGMLDNYYDLLLQCRGRWIADCAGDDFWTDPLKLEKEVRLIEGDPTVMIVHTAWQSFNEATRQASPSPRQPFPAPLTDGHDMLEAIITQRRMPVIHLCTAVYRADAILAEYQADPQLFRNKEWGCEDVLITFLLARRGRVAYLPDVTLSYSQGSDTLSGTIDDRRQFRFKRGVTNLSFHLAQTYHLKSPLTRRFFQQRVFELLMHAFRLHDAGLRNEAVALQHTWQAPNTLYISMIKLVLHSEPLWRFALKLREKLR